MSDASLQNDSRRTEITGVELRSDLKTVKVSGRLRSYRVVIDEISGSFIRVSEAIWQQLSGNGPIDPQLAMQARSAGLLRERREKPNRRFSILAIRIPLGSIDGLARVLAKASGLIFSPAAIVFWTMVISLTAIAVASRTEMLLVGLAQLPTYLAESSPLMIAVVFVLTKAMHELGHAVMCRRMGARCGTVGIMLLCGFPCPYCDVTDVWRQPSTIKRIVVMLAGMYVELIVAAVAAIVWMVSADPWIQLASLNVMLVCSVSTILFNANPLMRYDGYYVLGDIVDSVNLKEDAQNSFRSVVTRRVAGPRYQASKSKGRRAVGFAAYFILSRIYRIVISCAIAVLVIRVGSWFSMQSVATAVVVVVASIMVARYFRSLGGVVAGKGRWNKVPFLRRGGAVGALILLLAAMAFVPLPRYRSANGSVEAKSAQLVYIPVDGLVHEVHADFGDFVSEQESLLQLGGDDLKIKELKLKGSFRLASMRSRLSRRAALGNQKVARPVVDQQWETLKASENAVQAQLSSVQERLGKTSISSPIDGVLIPALNAKEASKPVFRLRDLNRTSISAGTAWCSVSPDGQLQASLVLDARDRKHVRLGSKVKISLASAPERVYETKITSVSAIAATDQQSINRAAYRVLCPLPEVQREELLTWVGQDCYGVIETDRRSLAKEMSVWLNGWFNG